MGAAPKEHSPHTVGGGASWGGQVAVPVGAATGVKWDSTRTVWTEGAFAPGIQGCSTDHIPSPPHIFKMISSSYTGFNASFVQRFSDLQSRWAALLGSSVLTDKGTCTQASSCVKIQVCLVFFP